MRAGVRSGVGALLALGALLACAVPAGAAEFGPIRLVSKGAVQQADEAVAPALSADGRYLAFAGKLGPDQGIFREDLASGAVEPVAVGPVTAGGPAASGTSPSISSDGRYVSFTTVAQLDADDDPQPSSRDVYVADMGTSPPSYELASALNGCDPDEAAPHTACGLTYGGSGGSEASGRVALSGDGREVAFVTTAESDLTSGPGASTEGVPTAAGQVVVRDLDTDVTRLVSAERDVGSGAMTERPVPGGGVISLVQLPQLTGAALSADGSTVAWLGAHLPAQVAMPAAEAKKIADIDVSTFPYDEPLWRRIADGPQAPIRRIVAGEGAADPFPKLTGKSTANVNGAEGWLGANVYGVPQLSADGRMVALIGNPTEATNVFEVDMSPGLTRGQALRQLTKETVINPLFPADEVNKEPYIPLTGHIYDLAISADGRRVAFTSGRQRFPLSPPNLVGAPPSSLGVLEVYVVNREAETLQRVTHGLSGQSEPSSAPNQFAAFGKGAASPSFGAGRLAFASTASNLTEGDGNESSDAFVVDFSEPPPGSGQVTLSPGPAQAPWKRPWRMTLSAFSLPDGGVRLVAVVPGAGKLRAGVGARLGTDARPRKLPARKAWALKSGPVPVELALPSRYQRLARSREGLFATVKVSFRRKGRPTLYGKLQVRFRVHPAKEKRG